MPTVGITGGVASGKSTFTTLLAECIGAEIFDSDRFVHALFQNCPATIASIAGAFGRGVLDQEGKIDRRELGKLVFSDAVQRQRLEAIVHPRVREGWRERMRDPDREREWLLVDIPLLFETGAEAELPVTVLVGCSQAVQMERLKRIRRVERERAEQMISAQAPLSSKVERATHVIWNDGSLEALRSQTEMLAEGFVSR